MYSSYNNRQESKAFKRALFPLFLSKVNRVESIPGNKEGVLCLVSFLLLVLELLCSYVYYSVYRVLSGKKTKPGELSYTWPGFTPSRLSKRRVSSCKELEYIECFTIGLVYKVRIFDFVCTTLTQ